MTIADLFTAINATTELKGRTFYSHKTADVKLPFCFIERSGVQYQYADDKNYKAVGDDCLIELYTARYDPTTEAVLDGVLITNGVTFSKTSSYDNDGGFFLTAYEITITN